MKKNNEFDDLDFYDNFFHEIGETIYDTTPHELKNYNNDNVTEIIYDKDFTLYIDNSLYQDLIKVKENLVEWLNSFDNSYKLEEDEFEDCYRIPKFFQFNENLDDELFDRILEELNGDYTHPCFDFSVIGNEYLCENSCIQFPLILHNFPEIITKINEVRKKLGGLNLSYTIDDDFKLYFMVDFPFDENNSYSDIVKEKAIECNNKITEEFYSSI